MKIRKFDQKEIEKNIDLYADGIYQIYKQIKNYRKGFFSLDKKYEDENVYGILVVLEESGIPREKVYLKVKSIIIDKEKEDNDPKRTMDYIHSHIKVISLKQVENFALNNLLLFRTIIVYLHKRNFEISNSVLTNEKSMNLSFAMLSRGTKNAS